MLPIGQSESRGKTLQSAVSRFAIRAGFLWAILLLPMMFVSCVWVVTARGIPQTQENVRDCVSGAESRGKKHNKKRSTVEPSMQACVEVRANALSVQEYLQKLVWDLRWTVNDEQATEDLWSFTMALNADELAAYTKPFSDPKIEWSAGKTAVNVRTAGLQDGFVRVVVTAKFDGYGVPEDKFAPKRESWPLTSSGALELKIANAVRDHFRTVH
jgi:hypothetical protein